MSQAFWTTSHQCQRFMFTRVFPPETSQEQFFDGTVHPVVLEFVAGQNCLFLTGEMYTIQGDQQEEENAGILQQCFDAIFNSISGCQCCTSTLLKPTVSRLTADQVCMLHVISTSAV